MRAFIISWFGDLLVKEKRKLFHQNQIDWLLSYNAKILIYAQEYKKEDFIIHPNIEYIEGPCRHPGEARNILLQHFYNSQDDFGLFLDNDAILDPKHQDGLNFLSNFNFNKLVENNIHCFQAINPGKEPFNKNHSDNKTLFNSNWLFKRHLDLKTTLFGLLNLKKLYGKELYFNPIYKPFGEDIDFALQLVHNGFKIFKCDNIVLKDFGHTVSTLIGTKKEQRNPEMTKAKEIIFEQWKEFGVILDKNNSIIRKHFTKKFWLGEIKIIIPKEENHFFG